MLGLSIPGVAYRNPSSLAARVNALFRAGEQGVWYDPSDRATLFQDAAGTTPVTAIEQPVGLMLDKSGRGNHAYQTTAASRPVLSARVNQYLNTATLATQNVTTLATTYTLRFEGAGSITLSGTATGTYTAGAHSVVCIAGTLTSTVTGTVTNADLRPTNAGVNLPPYQRVTTSTDYDTAGFPAYLKFDGIDDSLVTNSINFTATDKMTMFAGVRKLSDASAAMVAELSGDWWANNGTFALSAPQSAGQNSYNFLSKGTVAQSRTSSAFPSPITNTVTGVGDISGPGVWASVNGARFETVTGSQGTGNYGNYPLYIGSKYGKSLRFNGHLYGLIVRGTQSTDAQIASVERYVNGKTKAY